MASSIASYIVLSKDLATGRDIVREVPFEYSEINLPKQTAVATIGGILCCICDSKFGNKKIFESHYKTHNTGEIVYTCVACKKQHSVYQSFRNHCYLQHIVKHKFGCQQCEKTFSKQSALNAHISAIHDCKCGECDEIFTSKRDLQIHKLVHTKKNKEDPPYNCIKCSQVINSVDNCENHIDEHCEILYPCPICAIVLPNKKEATLHLTIHFDEKITPDMVKPSCAVQDSSLDTLGGILCCHCDTLFKNRLDIDSHFALEHDDKVVVYSCNICEKQYTKYNLFGDHCYFHIAKDKFQCEDCNRLFPRLSLLVMHNLAFHSEGAVDKPHRCDSCIYGFKTHYRLLEHKRLVHDEITIKCQVPDCSATFLTPKELIEHQRGHLSCVENWCRQCGLQFATLAACERHLDVHRRKQYACPVCARLYRERYLMLKHLPKHFESVLHICKICGRSYGARNRLIEHAKTHAEAKKHKCTICSKSFCRPHELQQHERVHTGAKPYRCTVCGRTFASYPNWTKHLTRAHAFDKHMIKEVREARNQTNELAAKPSPVKTESGIESAGSEVSDLCYGFIESDDSADERYGPVKKVKRELGLVMDTVDKKNNDGKVTVGSQSITETVNAAIDRIDEDLDFMRYGSVKKVEREINLVMDNVDKKNNDSKVTAGSQSITETVNAVIDRIDEDLDLMTPVELQEVDLNDTTATDFTAEFNEVTDFNVDDSSDIKAIVEHIDALSGGIEITSQPADMMQFTDMLPVENILYSVPVYTTQVLPEPQYYQPSDGGVPLEYGPDFTTLGSEEYATNAINPNDHVLPHIDPLLTIKAEQNAKIFVHNVQHLQNNLYGAEHATVPGELDQNWQPILTKVFSHDEANDNRMYVLNGNIF